MLIIYNKTYDTVYVPDRYYFDDSYEYLVTILHECCHSTSHFEINVQVSESTAGNNLKIDAPQIIYTMRHGIEIEPKIELQIVEIQLQHEGTCSLLKDAYHSGILSLIYP
nr:zincin-like metallopeptidase domain-containing protein [Faecalibacillus intestinalis]